MLVLSRKSQEEIVIGGNIRITVVEVSGGRVKLGITAPVEIPVHRAEISDRMRRNEKIAGPVTGPRPFSLRDATLA